MEIREGFSVISEYFIINEIKCHQRLTVTTLLNMLHGKGRLNKEVPLKAISNLLITKAKRDSRSLK